MLAGRVLRVCRNKYFENQYLNGEVGLELIPQGTIIERIRAHAVGMPAVYTPTGAHTAVETGDIPIRYKTGGISAGVLIPGNKKNWREYGGRRFLEEPAIVGDVAFVHAWKADEAGNLVFKCVSPLVALAPQIAERFVRHDQAHREQFQLVHGSQREADHRRG
jgi:acyl CoA:acetate/3-ketoacid CoA transferase alpha subunit